MGLCPSVCPSQVGVLLKRLNESSWLLACELPSTSAFLWRYEPVRRTGKSDDWLTIFCSHNNVHCSEILIVLSNLLYHYFFIELRHILILWLAKMPNGGMPVFTLIATGWQYRKIFFYKKSTAFHPSYTVLKGNSVIFKHKGTSLWNFVLNSALRKFRHGISIVETCYQLSSRKVGQLSR